MRTDDLEDKLDEMLSQVAKDLVMVSNALLEDDCEENAASSDRIDLSRSRELHRMKGDGKGTCGLPSFMCRDCHTQAVLFRDTSCFELMYMKLGYLPHITRR